MHEALKYVLLNASDRQIFCFKLHRGADIIKSAQGYYHLVPKGRKLTHVEIGSVIKMSRNTAHRAV